MTPRSIKGKKHLKINLGCGSDIRLEWINIDAVIHLPDGFEYKDGHIAKLLEHDLIKNLPLQRGSCSIIYSSHFFEHLTYNDADRLIRQCFSALEDGGVFRAALPDFRSAVEAYVRNDKSYFSELENVMKDTPVMAYYTDPGTGSLIDYINYCIYQQGEHHYMWDTDKMLSVLKNIGFRSFYKSEFRPDMDIDSALRQRYSFYIEAIK